MLNELLIVATLLFTFGSVLLWYRVLGKAGLYALTAFLTITANIEVCILVDAFGIEMTLGNALFAGTFLATDILSECYGKKEASRCVLVGVISSLSMVILTNIWLMYVPSANDWVHPAIKTVFSNTPRVLIVSLVVYAVCQFIDVRLYHAIWRLTGSSSRYLWARNNGATLVSQALNAILFNIGAFYGTVDSSVLLSLIVANFVFTIFTSLLDTPIVYLARRV